MLQEPNGLMLLCRNAYLLFIVIEIFRADGRISNVRGALFGDFVDILIDHEEKMAADRSEPWPADLRDRLMGALTTLAETMQLDRNVTELARAEAIGLLGDERLLKLAIQCSLLQDNGVAVRFSHQLLQEFFASRALGDALDRGVPATKYWPPERWWKRTGREQTAILLAGVRAAGGWPKLAEVVTWLALAQPKLALDCVTEADTTLVSADSAQTDPVGRSILDTLIAGARAKQVERDARGRAAAYRVLSRLHADTRPATGIIRVGQTTLPDLNHADYWCKVPAGPFIMGSDQDQDNPKRTERIDYDYWVGQYPITYVQYRAFVEAPEGYANARWWADLHSEGLALQKAGAGEQSFEYDTHPAEGVSWYEAMAYCAWLTAQWRAGVLQLPDFLPRVYELRLPLEAEWEKAARGTDGREYPYPGEFDPAKGNVWETYIGHTSAVGIFPSGVSPYGALDMAGNVWEWCWNEYQEPGNRQLGSNSARPVRGGSWDFNLGNSRAAYRNVGNPASRNYGLGLRVVVSVPVEQR